MKFAIEGEFWPDLLKFFQALWKSALRSLYLLKRVLDPRFSNSFSIFILGFSLCRSYSNIGEKIHIMIRITMG